MRDVTHTHWQFVTKAIALVIFLFFSSIAAFLSFSPTLYAQEGGIDTGETGGTNPKPRQANVTATVADHTPPSVPILIAPDNGSTITDSTPTFIWEGSTDDRGIGKYELYLDGSVLFGSIPTGATTNSSYTLTYDSATHRYSLTPSTALAEGNHTWKVRAIDIYDNYTDSVTWSFTLDSPPPTFILTDIGEVEVSISAQDITTVPDEPIEIEENEPLLLATGEANSTVEVTLTIPGYDN